MNALYCGYCPKTVWRLVSSLMFLVLIVALTGCGGSGGPAGGAAMTPLTPPETTQYDSPPAVPDFPDESTTPPTTPPDTTTPVTPPDTTPPVTVLPPDVTIPIVLPDPVVALEVDFYNCFGDPTAYVDTTDMTIYLWSGKPVAYLFMNSYDTNTVHVYGFNGKHLGWYQRGILYDANGYLVGCEKELLILPHLPSTLKGFKQFKPFKQFREFAPFKPFFFGVWSTKDLLNSYLLGGVDY